VVLINCLAAKGTVEEFRKVQGLETEKAVFNIRSWVAEHMATLH